MLGRLKERQAAGPLKERLTDGHAEVRKQAALALGYLGAQDAEPDLRRLAERDAAHSVREAALQALAALAAAR